MKIGILFEGNPNNPGGFNQALQSAININEISNKNNTVEFVVFNKDSLNALELKKIKVKKFKFNFFSKIYNFLYNFQSFKNLIINYKIKHPFSKFIEKHKYELMVFLSPHELSLHCGEVNFIVNIWDIDHKKNNPFPEHKKNHIFLKREFFLNYILFHSYKIIVPEKQTKNELIEMYKCDKNKIEVQPFISILPRHYENEKGENINYSNIFDNLNLPKDKKIIFYPSTFWAHKNHKYLLDTAHILKSKKNYDFFFVFVGQDKGNLNFIAESIKKLELDSLIKILPFSTNDEIISLYLNSSSIVMPTTGGPTNLPLYESIYFQKPIYYSDHLVIDDKLKKYIIDIDTKNPEDFYLKLINKQNDSLNDNIKNSKELYNDYCSADNFKKTYSNIFDEFSNISKRWK
jgi:glycosyltransferase involved in cell wall biosynthesis